MRGISLCYDKNYGFSPEQVGAWKKTRKQLSDYIDVVLRRKWYLILPIVIIFAISLVAAVVWPRTYRSTITILIEEQEIPRDFVITTVTGFVEQRLQSINQRIMSTTRLLEIINHFGLYAELKRKMTTEEIVDLMRKDIKLQMISADVADKRSSTPMQATIAFSLSYDGKKPPDGRRKSPICSPRSTSRRT